MLALLEQAIGARGDVGLEYQNIASGNRNTLRAALF
jgi:hypothetical protein